MTQPTEDNGTLAQMRGELGAPVTRVAWGVGTIMLSLLAPFDLDETTTLLSRAVYWFILIGVAIFWSITAKYGLLHFFPQLAPLHMTALTAFVFAAVYTPIIYLTNYLLIPERLETMARFPELFGLVLLVFFCLAAVIGVVRHQYAAPDAERPATPAASLLDVSIQGHRPPALARRLDHNLQRASIIRLSMQDHYVEVHTDSGSQLILMRMSDAISELDGVAGLRVHRSHWVATDAVTGSMRERGRLCLLTRDGAEVPVSRSYSATVREVGLV